MKFVYVDESGTGGKPISVMVGIIADAYRMRQTKEDWEKRLQELRKIIGKKIFEIHTNRFYSRNGIWNNLEPKQKEDTITAILEWLKDRKHQIVYTAVVKDKFNKDLKNNERLNEIGSLWRFMALHIALSLQKCYQGGKRGRYRIIQNKGGIILIFDHENKEEEKFTNLLLSPPDWTDTYYDKMPNQKKMNQIIDVPHFVNSHQVGLIQLADFICFFLRRYIELKMGIDKPKYEDELSKIQKWIEPIFKLAIPKNNIFLSKGRCECSNLFYEYAPDVIKENTTIKQ